MTGGDTQAQEIEALKADIARRRQRRQEALDRVGHLVSTIEVLSATMRRVGINAMIEAARAGKAGAAFAVVAAEIKELANEMQIATEEATALLNGRDED